jgi:preprotein translocase subunit SecD
MNSNLRWKAISVAAVVLLCFYGLFGLPEFPTSLSQIKQNFSKRILLGLDLQGGTHLILQVHVNDALVQDTLTAMEQLGKLLQPRGIPHDQITQASDTQLKVTGITNDHGGEFRSLVADSFSNYDVAPAAGEANAYLLTMKPSVISSIQQRTMDVSVDTIRRRIDQLGLTEPFVAPYGQGDNEIIVELPGEGDPMRAKEIIKAGGQLEIVLVPDPRPYPSEVEARSAHNGVLPPGTQLVRGKGVSTGQGQPALENWYIVNRVPIVTGKDLRGADARRSTDHAPYFEVTFNLSTDAARRFGPFTEQNIGNPMAIVLDHRAQSVATIEGRIDDSGRITGSFTEEEANDLALVLRAGALPAGISYLDERTVGPSLGADSIRHGIQASITSLVVVMIFMVVYYRTAGVNAVVALILNLFILLAALAYFSAVLTLPGIAGVILTIGMGVDSNVLIFERIREELRGGKAPVSAVDQGFKRAFVTIIDTHVTTIVSAFFLFLFGSGPVRGFAVSLTIGLLANLFTSVYVSRLIFDWHLGKSARQTELSI